MELSFREEKGGENSRRKMKCIHFFDLVSPNVNKAKNYTGIKASLCCRIFHPFYI